VLLAATETADTPVYGAPIWVWATIVAVILAMLLVDLLVFHKDAHSVTIREAAISSAVWVTIGLSFGLIVLAWHGGDAATQYYSGYLIEKSLSIDNIFVFALLFSYFAVPAALQHRVLFWGVIGALVFRALFIAAGAALLDRFSWTVFIFGAFLIYTGIKMARHGDTQVEPDHNPVVGLVRRAIPITPEYRGTHFFVMEAGKRWGTPLLVVLVAIETTDIIFAVDSIPAIFAVTRDPFIVFTSNAFAILGLRALYFLLADAMGRFSYLKVGLAVVLVYVGVKMVLAGFDYHIDTRISLLVIAGVITTAVVMSLRASPAEVAAAEESEKEHFRT
jgi:tellurite resistance protein TerC